MPTAEETQKQQHTAQEFAEAYQKLCQEYGFTLVAVPTFLPTNHGTFEIRTELQAISAKQ